MLPTTGSLSRRPIQVMKFGGTSVTGADGLRAATSRTGEAWKARRVLLATLAMAGVTDLLVSCTRLEGGASRQTGHFPELHRKVVQELATELGESIDSG